MNTLYVSLLRAALAAVLCAVLHPVAVTASEPAPVQREIIPGSELMTAQERERYRQQQRGAGSAEERERLRAEHVKAMEVRGRTRGLAVIDHSRNRKAQP
jgi:hypothetical protein